MAAEGADMVPGKFFVDGQAQQTMSLNATRAAVEAAIGQLQQNDYLLVARVTKTNANGIAVRREPKIATDWRQA